MKAVKQQLEELKTVKRKKHHPLIHKIHKKHGISKKTLFYVKEYGPHTNVTRTIIKESFKILLLASILSSLGGLALEYTKTVFISIVPLIILLPALNGMIGGYGIIISSRFVTMLYEGRIKKDWLKMKELKTLFRQVFLIAIVTASISSIAALITSGYSGYYSSVMVGYKILLISILDTAIIVTVLFLISILAGFYFYRKKEDPNNFLIPITTSVADFGNMIVLSLLVVLFF